MSMQKIKNLNKEDFENLQKELKIIKEMSHPSLLKFIGFSLFDFKKNLKPVILTEYSSDISLENVIEIKRMNKKIPEWTDTKKLINIFGIASGMSYLHSHGIVHRSLKPSNIYLNEILTPKIGDFGLSTRFLNEEKITFQSISGIKATPIYSAPEVLQFNRYSKSSDVYSFSLIVYEIMTNEKPFEKFVNQNQIFNEIVINKNRPELKKNVPESYKRLIERCWSQDANERPTFDEIVYFLKSDSGFITDYIINEDYQKYIKFIEEQNNQQKDLL